MTSKVPVTAGEGLENTAYYLLEPSKPQETSRLSIQHDTMVLAVGGLFPLETEPLVRAALADNGVKGAKKILDVGSGNGAWTMDMARQFPSATVLGLDIDPAKPTDPPPNCSFALGDFCCWNDIAAIKGQKFDVIHSRFTRSWMKDVAKVYDDITRSLAPGGVFLLGDGAPRFYIKRDGQYLAVPSASTGDPVRSQDNIGPDNIPLRSWFMRFTGDLFARVDLQKGYFPHHWSEICPILEENSKRSRESKGGYNWQVVGSRQYYLPMGWDGDEEDVKMGLGKEVGEAARQTSLLLLRIWREVVFPAFVRNKDEEGTVDDLVRCAEEEISDPTFRLYLYFGYDWAVMGMD